MAPGTIETLRALAARYIWWKSPEEAIATPRRVVAQVMDIGDYDDVQRLAKAVGENTPRDALAEAEPGWFSGGSWAYWHYRLGLAPADDLPPPPVRKLS